MYSLFAMKFYHDNFYCDITCEDGILRAKFPILPFISFIESPLKITVRKY